MWAIWHCIEEWTVRYVLITYLLPLTASRTQYLAIGPWPSLCFVFIIVWTATRVYCLLSLLLELYYQSSNLDLSLGWVCYMFRWLSQPTKQTSNYSSNALEIIQLHGGVGSSNMNRMMNLNEAGFWQCFSIWRLKQNEWSRQIDFF